MRYYIPEWDDRIDTDYDFGLDRHSPNHNGNPKNDSYMWQIFNPNSLPLDGVLVSLMTLKKNKGKAARVHSAGGLRNYLHLPEHVSIMADCGAWGYYADDEPPFDAVEVLERYRNLGVNEAVTVDHLVHNGHNPGHRMELTRRNGVRGFDAWEANYKRDFELLVSVQGLQVSDYLEMVKFYSDHGIRKLAFGGLARKTTSFTSKLISEFLAECDRVPKRPERVHFFGLARAELFERFEQLEKAGIEVSFDTSSWLRRAWLNGHYYMIDRNQFRIYTSIRVPFADPERTSFRGKRKLGSGLDTSALRLLEAECLRRIRAYGNHKLALESVLKSIGRLDSLIIKERIAALKEHPNQSANLGARIDELSMSTAQYGDGYSATLRDRPWEKCNCPICKRLGIEVVLFRGNNRNRARGFHNVFTMYQMLHERALWPRTSITLNEWKTMGKDELIEMGGRVLVLTGCTKTKLGYDGRTRARAVDMYQGRIFKEVRKYAKRKGFPMMIISAKYGLIGPEEVISGYEKVISTIADVQKLKPLVASTLRPILPDFDKVIVIAGDRYRQTLEDVRDRRFSFVKSGGYAKLAQLMADVVEELQPKLVSYL